MMYSAYKLSKQGDNIQPWHTPFLIWHQSVVPCPVLTVTSWLDSFPDLTPVCCSMSSSNCYFLTIQISQEAGKTIWYSHLFKNFPQFVVIHTVKGLGIVNKAEVFLELSCFFLWSRGCWQFDLWFLCLIESVSHSVCPTLCDPTDCSPPGSSVHGILQARIREWVAIPFSRESSQPRDWTWVFCIAGRFFQSESGSSSIKALSPSEMIHTPWSVFPL